MDHHVTFLSDNPNAPRRYRSAVSLHSHTAHSLESLAMVPDVLRRTPFVDGLVRVAERRYFQTAGERIDFSRLYFTPPLAPAEAFDAERSQIEERLGRSAIVSLTDHDTIAGCQELRRLRPDVEVPVSVEWTIPFGPSYLHLGVHNVPERSADALMLSFARVSSGCSACRRVGSACFGAHRFLAGGGCGVAPLSPSLGDVLREAAAPPDSLGVRNHPMWDSIGLSEADRERLLATFLAIHGDAVHALELNGLRPWRENRATAALAARWNLPLVAGGDRHGCEPGAMLNLTNAATFAELATEIRKDRHSRILVMPQYAEPLDFRKLQTAWDVLRDYPRHSYGWHRWSDRVFYKVTPEISKPISEVWAASESTAVRGSMGIMRLLERWPLRYALRHALAENAEALA
jgi:hypothetical protein